MTSAELFLGTGAPHGFELPGSAPPLPWWRPKQVHGRDFVAAQATGSDPGIESDGVLSSVPGLPAVIAAADCAPLLLATANGRSVAAIHAGWRGLAAGIVEAGVARLRELQPGQRVIAAIGPGASGCCYEVGPEVLAALAPAAPRVLPTSGGRARLDLRGIAADRLQAAGLDPADIEVVGPCTICSPDWPSFRRQRAAAGRLLAWIAPRGRVAFG